MYINRSRLVLEEDIRDRRRDKIDKVYEFGNHSHFIKLFMLLLFKISISIFDAAELIIKSFYLFIITIPDIMCLGDEFIQTTI